MTAVPTFPEPARAWSYDEFVEDALAIVPAWAPQWTDHNPSDPGITLVELLAYYAEILAYRALRVTPDAELAFLSLMTGREHEALVGVSPTILAKRIRGAVAELARPQVAVTAHDYEQLAIDAARTVLGPDAAILARCFPDVDPRAWKDVAPGEVAVVLASDAADLRGACDEVAEQLAQRCLLTTRVHVVPAVVVEVRIGCRLALRPGFAMATAEAQVGDALRSRFDPLRTAASSAFGRPTHMGDVIAAIDDVEAVDYVEHVTVNSLADGPSDGVGSQVGVRVGEVAAMGVDTRLGGAASVALRRLETDAAGEVVSVLAQPWEIMRVSLARADVAGPRAGRRR